MRRFFIYLSLIVLLILSSTLILDVIYSLAFQNVVARNKIQLTANTKDKYIDYIFLGSSRVENHIDCDLITKLTGKSCLNLGEQGAVIQDYAVLAQLLHTNKITYDKLLIQVDYSYNMKGNSRSFLAKISPFINKDNYKEQWVEQLEFSAAYDLPFYRYAANDNLIGFREMVMQVSGKKVTKDLENGYEALSGFGTQISGHFPQHIDYPNDSFERMIARDTDNIILFTSPYCYNSENRDGFMNELQSKYPGLHNYIDLFDDEERMFVNCGHLNINGSQEFTRILTNDLLLN